MGKSEDDIIELVGPPGSKGSRSKDADMSDDEEATESDDEGDREAAEVSAMDEYSSAMADKSATSEEKLDAFKKLLAIVS